MTSAPRPNKHRLLVITYHFPPDGSVGGLRWSGLSKYLARRGWEVHVVTAAPQEGVEPIPNVVVHHVPRAHTLNDRYNAWAKARSNGNGGSGGSGFPTGASSSRSPAVEAPGFLGSMRNLVGSLLAFPDVGRGWILRAAKVARTLMHEGDFDAVVSSGPPHAAHIVGTLSCFPRMRCLIVDMRDPWATGHSGDWIRGLFGNESLGRLVERIERGVFNRARRLIANTREFATVLHEQRPDKPVSFVPNGIDVERLPAPAEKHSGFSLAHAGTLYIGRDLAPVVSALHEFLVRHPEGRDTVRLRVAGHLSAANAERFHTQMQATQTEDVVEILGQVSRGQALDLINRSHLALVLAQNQTVQVPAKLYECIALGVPTLVITEPDSASAAEATRIGAMWREASDIDGIRDVIEGLWSGRLPGSVSSPEISYERVAEAMERVLLEGSDRLTAPLPTRDAMLRT